MTDSVVKRLLEMPKERLVKTVLAALGEMNEKEQISFIAKHIDARITFLWIGMNCSRCTMMHCLRERCNIHKEALVVCKA